jgi:hypothetical protein
MPMKVLVAERFTNEFGTPDRITVKVKSWKISNGLGAVLQIDQPIREDAAFVWLPHPGDGAAVPEIALEYPGEVGRHSGTYPCPGLELGQPALRVTIRTPSELDAVIDYMRALSSARVLREPQIFGQMTDQIPAPQAGEPIEVHQMPKPEPLKPRREAIPRSVQREVWQRDGGRCVECSTREKLCFDHIIPFSKGGSNSIRNLQLLCEKCNLAKSNYI